MTTFGPQLIGEIEKTLQALLCQALVDTGLDERHWVALRLADQPDGAALRDRVSDRAHFDDADELVVALEQRRLVAHDALTVDGKALLQRVLAKSAALSGPIWDDVDGANTAAHALVEVLTRARSALETSA